MPDNSVMTNNSDFVLRFHDPKALDSAQNEIGRLKMDDYGELTFEGDADASAEAFFNIIVSCNSLAIKRYRRALERISCTSTDEASREIAKDEL